nr:hypothetical protein GCM10020093_001160 [Planobispora longispora]
MHLARLVAQQLELLGVQLARLDPEQVTVIVMPYHVPFRVAQEPPQLPHVTADERPVRGRGSRFHSSATMSPAGTLRPALTRRTARRWRTFRLPGTTQPVPFRIDGGPRHRKRGTGAVALMIRRISGPRGRTKASRRHAGARIRWITTPRTRSTGTAPNVRESRLTSGLSPSTRMRPGGTARAP